MSNEEETKLELVESALDELVILEIDIPRNRTRSGSVDATDLDDATNLPKSNLLVITEKEILKDHDTSLEVIGEKETLKNEPAEKKELETQPVSHSTTAVIEPSDTLQGLVDTEFHLTKVRKVEDWDPTAGKFYSDYIHEGMQEKERGDEKVVMLFESPSSSDATSSFHNKSKYRFHDWPPPKSNKAKAVLGPCRYAMMNGNTCPVFLKGGTPPAGMLEHWESVLPPGMFKAPSFQPKIEVKEETVYAYLPVEALEKSVNSNDLHYHLAGKDAIVVMTTKTTKILPDTRTVRPCVVKTTHSMGSKGIFIINNDEDEQEFLQFLQDSGNPTFVVTAFVDIARNVACHFFISPSGHVTWFGSNENKRDEHGKFTSDSYLSMKEQEQLKQLQLPFVEEIVSYCQSLGFWGFCGVDVLIDSHNNGYLVDINPRVTGSCPALMTLKAFQNQYGFEVGLFRRSGDICYFGHSQDLLNEVTEYNQANEGKSRIVLHSFNEVEDGLTKVNIGVYGNDMEECKTVLNRFAKPARHDE